MKSAYPATPLHRRLLRTPPGQAQCLLPRERETLSNLSHMVVYLWLKNGRGFWYHITSVRNNALLGYALRGEWWRYQPISKQSILRYY